MPTSIALHRVTKSYPLYHHITGGIKNFLFRFPQAIKTLHSSHFMALKDVSFSIEKGETFGFIGRNGSGKSTLLGLMAGVILPTSGRVEVNGRVSPLLELGGGFHPDLTGRENITLNGVLLGLKKKMVLQKMDEVIEFSGLGAFIDEPIRTYSSGMLARLGFSVVVHLDPQILLIDEVLAVGDMEFQKKCRRKILDFKEKGTTIVLVSHSMDDIRELCDRAAWIDAHQVKMIGSASDVVDGYIKSYQ
jgi:lipopolysaccharide transport system ATP-binding protein